MVTRIYLCFETRSFLPPQLYLDHSHCLVLAPATLAALPSIRAIETRLLPSSLAATHRGFAFYVASPKSSIPSIATCSMSLISSSSIVLIRGKHETFNRLARDESVHNLGDVRDCDASVKQVIGFD